MYGDEKKTKGEMGDERQKMKEAEKAYQKAKEEYEEKETVSIIYEVSMRFILFFYV